MRLYSAVTMCLITVDIIRYHCSSTTIPTDDQFIYHQRDVTAAYYMKMLNCFTTTCCSIVIVTWGRGGRCVCACVCMCVCVWGGGYSFTYFFLFSSLFAGI